MPKTTPKSGLKLDGKPLQIGNRTVADAIIDAMMKAPTDELYTAPEIARKTGRALTYIQSQSTNPKLEAFSYKLSKSRIYGHPKAIIALRKQLQEQS